MVLVKLLEVVQRDHGEGIRMSEKGVVGVLAVIAAYVGLHILNRGNDTNQTPSPGQPPGTPPRRIEGGEGPTWPFDWQQFRIDVMEACPYSGAADSVAVDGTYQADIVAFDRSQIPCLQRIGWRFTLLKFSFGQYHYKVIHT